MKLYQVTITDKGLEEDDTESFSRSSNYIVFSSLDKAINALETDLREDYGWGNNPAFSPETLTEWLAEITGTFFDQGQALEQGAVLEISFEDELVWVQINRVFVDQMPPSGAIDPSVEGGGN